jgi:hypothetical protein
MIGWALGGLIGAGKWRWTGRKGHITAADEHCFSVRRDDGVMIHDVRDHFRPANEE